jgi:hypothetical protein
MVSKINFTTKSHWIPLNHRFNVSIFQGPSPLFMIILRRSCFRSRIRSTLQWAMAIVLNLPSAWPGAVETARCSSYCLLVISCVFRFFWGWNGCQDVSNPWTTTDWWMILRQQHTTCLFHNISAIPRHFWWLISVIFLIGSPFFHPSRAGPGGYTFSRRWTGMCPSSLSLFTNVHHDYLILFVLPQSPENLWVFMGLH